ncbi:hypothetical protein K6V98_03790 [Collinsella sp. AGMB00827]|uniref:LysM domain-containing protein n=1 Tax=Collinsella ureilytica TaxID=2869515 RepID=A0ABS7MJD5_9ACTN|nr:hypothetical protein [Collinsella urealyticum]MBY4797478.1 hypothetical protein [Collinsella urealyticum]
MGMIRKKDDQKEVIEGVEVIFSGEGPNGAGESPIELIGGQSAEDIAAGITPQEAEAAAQAAALADARDEALMDGIESPKMDRDEEMSETSRTPEVENTPAPVEDEQSSKAANEPASAKRSPLDRRLVLAIFVVIALVAGGVIGYFIDHGGFGSHGVNARTISEDKLDTVVASLTYNGSTHQITVREALESQGTLEAAKGPDGDYRVPSADVLLGHARNRILLNEAEAQGISVGDDEAKEYAKTTLGTDSYDEIATQYNTSKESAERLVKENATIKKLYDKVVPAAAATVPEQPTAPAEGSDGSPTKEYADYIIKLAGNEWDSEKGAWAEGDGPFHQAFKDKAFSADGATYEQAQTAYMVAYQAYAQEMQGSQSAWLDYVNGLYGKADINLYGLYM